MSKNKTTETEINVTDFLNKIIDEKKRKDCFELVLLIKKLSGVEPKMWGSSIVGFGSHHYKYASGREGDSPNVAFSPRSSSIAIYLSADFNNREELLQNFGKHKTEKGCIHIKSLADVDTAVLNKMIINHIKHIKELYPATKK